MFENPGGPRSLYPPLPTPMCVGVMKQLALERNEHYCIVGVYEANQKQKEKFQRWTNV